jgi:hypothetical protein
MGGRSAGGAFWDYAEDGIMWRPPFVVALSSEIARSRSA